jgi:hypothetical protein
MALTLVLTLTPAHPAVAGGTTYGPPSSPLPEFNAGELPETPWMSPQAIELIVNGGFESGSPLPSGWTTVEAGQGRWFQLGGPGTGPLSGMPFPAPAQGSLQMMTDMTGGGRHILYQDVTIPPLATASLNLVLWYTNYANFVSQPHLDYTTFIPNQQFRIDIMNPAAAIDDVGAGVFLNVFATGPASPSAIGYTPISADLNAFQGQTIRLRFVEVDNQHYLNVGVDAVSIQAEPLVPTRPATWGELKARYH